MISIKLKRYSSPFYKYLTIFVGSFTGIIGFASTCYSIYSDFFQQGSGNDQSIPSTFCNSSL